jgi:DNA (cytosine-5)-methyltransferase 1
MQIIDIFSGIGGFSIAGRWMGWRTVQFCEMNEFCNRVLNYYWQGVPIHTDIKTLTAEQIINNGLYDKEETTILTGGVPCQPWSHAGKRKGAEDDRNLWPQTIKLIGSLQPDFAVLENVPGILTWNKGIFLEQMLASLEAKEYEVIPFILPACGVNAPHRRDRVWFIAKRINANATSMGCRQRDIIRGEISKETRWPESDFGNKSQIITDPGLLRQKGCKQQTTGIEQCNKGDFANTCCIRLEGGLQTGINAKFNRESTERRKISEYLFKNRTEIQFENFPTQSPLCSRDDGISGRLDGITFPRWRNESIKAYGNAIVPAVAYQIFKAIEKLT